MRQFAGREPFSVDVGDFLELERSLQRSGEAYAATDEHDAAITRCAFRKWSDDITGTGSDIQYMLDLSRDALEGRENLFNLLSRHTLALMGKKEAQQVEHCDGADKGFRRHYADLWTC